MSSGKSIGELYLFLCHSSFEATTFCDRIVRNCSFTDPLGKYCQVSFFQNLRERNYNEVCRFIRSTDLLNEWKTFELFSSNQYTYGRKIQVIELREHNVYDYRYILNLLCILRKHFSLNISSPLD